MINRSCKGQAIEGNWIFSNTANMTLFIFFRMKLLKSDTWGHTTTNFEQFNFSNMKEWKRGDIICIPSDFSAKHTHNICWNEMMFCNATKNLQIQAF
jgi:hypothetical protein